MRVVGVLTVCAKMRGQQAPRILALGDALVGPVPAVQWLNQMATGPCGVAVANNNVGWCELSTSQFNTARPTAFGTDKGHRRVVTDRDLTVAQQLDQFTHNGADA
ncbi:MAG: hypothetical protein WCO22_00730 [Betaproteobacteria bacterium]